MSSTQAQQQQQFARGLHNWQRFKNFGDGSCGIYSQLQQFLVLRCEMHPSDAELAFSCKKSQGIVDLVRLCRSEIVNKGRVVFPDEDSFGLFTGGDNRAQDQSNQIHLDTRRTWEDAILEDDGHLDLRAMGLLASLFGIEPLKVAKLRRRGWGHCVLEDVHGFTTPLDPTGCVYHEGNHFEFMVYKENVSHGITQ